MLRQRAARLGLALAVVEEIDSTNAELVRLARGLPGATGLPVPTATTIAAASPAFGQTADQASGDAADQAADQAADRVTDQAAEQEGGRGGFRGAVLVAERQTAGRGRLDRSWQSSVGAGLMVSLLVRPAVAVQWLGWLPLVVGTSLTRALRSYAGIPAVLKWPNDVQADGAKLAGVLVELAPSPAAPPAVVIGFGLNVTALDDELPPRSTSLLLQDVDPARLDRQELLGVLLTDLVGALARWEAAPDQAGDDYRAVCATLGRAVRVELPDGTSRLGTATDVDALGRLVVDGQAYSAADVIHLR